MITLVAREAELLLVTELPRTVEEISAATNDFRTGMNPAEFSSSKTLSTSSRTASFSESDVRICPGLRRFSLLIACGRNGVISEEVELSYCCDSVLLKNIRRAAPFQTGPTRCCLREAVGLLAA